MELKKFLAESVSRQASDLHIAPNEAPRLRVDGDLLSIAGPLCAESARAMILSLMSSEQQAALSARRELDFAVVLPGVARFRVNAFHQAHGLAAVYRVVAEEVSTLDQLDLPAVFKKLLHLPHGLILVTGPTGCGKSTTLAAMLHEINLHQSAHIITIEDPVEFIHRSQKSLINQRQIQRDTQDFSAALRSALRQDPDVIMLGEMRDLETVRLALTAAETGHLVMATLHTSSAPRTVNRIIDVFPAGEKNMIRNMLSESLQAVICQTLVKKINGGRIPAFEIMLGTPAVRNLIREDKITQMVSCMQTGMDAGMCTMEQYLQGLMARRVIIS